MSPLLYKIMLNAVMNAMRTFLLVVAILQYNVRTTVTKNFISSNVCLATDVPSSSSKKDRASGDSIEQQNDATKAAKLTLHNDTSLLNELFRVKSCPSQCLSIQDDETMFTNLRKTMKQSEHESASRDRPKTVRIFYFILIHNQRSANDALYLFRAIRDPNNIIVIHFDKKVEYLLSSTQLTLLQEIQSCPCGSNVRVESVHSVEWSKWSMNLPTLWGMEIASSPQYVHEWDVFINLSGDTIPVYTPSTMARKLYDVSSYNFVASRSCETGLVPTNVYTFPKYWHKRRHYTMDGTEPDPVFTFRNTNNEIRNKTVVTHFGSQWIIVQNNFVTWLVDQLQDKNSWPSQFRDYLEASGKLMTDETFIPSILMHVNANDDGVRPMLPKVETSSGRLIYKNGTLSDIYHMRYERMDEHYPTSYGKFPSVQHYQVPESFVQQSVLDQPKVWGPYFLGTYDLGDIRDSGALYARKVSSILDRNMIELLPVDRTEDIPPIHWPIEISITKRPDWTVEKEMWDELHVKTVLLQNQRNSPKKQLDAVSGSSSDSGGGHSDTNDDDEEL